jgi:glycosyltransferase involved in cell wall biosynthesis
MDSYYYRKKFPRIADRIETIPIPLDVKKFVMAKDREIIRKKYGLNESSRIILYAGRLSKVKRVDNIIRAFRLVGEDYPKALLVIVGDGEEETRLRKMISVFSDRIVFLGRLSHDDMPDILCASDVLVMASETEGMPTIALEALACGLPVVSTGVGDMARLISNEKIGFVTDQGDIEDYGKKMIRALEISDKFREERVAVALKFSADAVSRKVLDLHMKHE